jgi:hypothetical protein
MGTSACSVTGPYVATQTYGSFGTALNSVAAIPNEAGVYVGVSTPTNQELIVATTPSPPLAGSAPNVSVTALPAGQSIVTLVSSSSNAYALVPQSSPSPTVVLVDRLGSGGTLSTVATLPSGLQDILAFASQPAIAPNGWLGATTFSSAFDGPYVALLNPNDASPADWDVVQPVAGQCNGAAYDTLDTLWVLCTSSPTSVSLYRILPTSTWTILPGTTVPVSIYAGCSSGAITGEYFLGALEGLTSTSGPLTLSSTSPNITGRTPVGDRGIAVSFSLPPTSGSGSNPLTIAATVTDAHGRSMAITFDVSAQTFGCSRPRPPQRVWRHSGTRNAEHRVTM